MKKKLFLTVLTGIFLLSGIIEGKDNSLKVSPAKPKAGDKVTVTFNPAGTNLEKAEKIKMSAYFCSDKTVIDLAVVEMEKKNSLFTGSFKVNEKAEIVGLKFSEGKKVEANNKKGYYIRLYNNKGKESDAGLAIYALAPYSWGRFIGAETDLNAAYKNLKNLFKTKPAIKDKYVKDYITIMMNVLKEKGFDLIAAELKKMEEKSNLTAEDYSYFQRIYGQIKQKDKADEYKKIILEKFPKDPAAAMFVYMNISSEKNLDKKLELFASFKKDFPASPYVASGIYSINNLFIKEKKYKEGAEFINKYMDDISPVYMGYIAKGYIYAKQELDLAYNLSKAAVDKARQKLNSTENKPAYLSNEEWLEQNNSSIASAVATLAEASASLGKKEEALGLYQEALSSLTGDNADPGLNEKYINLLYELNKIDKASKEIETLITAEMPTESRTALAKKIYIKKNGSETDFDTYLAKLTKDAKNYLNEKLKKEMINEPAPDFTLYDLDGKKVTLSSLKGKIVIVDFWATWCGPCVGSFPGMQKALNVWKDKGVEFLFVNTWQTIPEESKGDKNWKKNNAAEFIKKNNYTLHVLLDEEDKVVASYKVSGIPTKFVIDKNGRIRFNVVGSDGIDDKTVAEISTMIELIK